MSAKTVKLITVLFFLLSQLSQIAAVMFARSLAVSPFTVVSYLSSPALYFLVLALLLQAWLWQQVLKVMPLSTIYPLTAIQFPILAIVGGFYYHEAVEFNMMVGIGLIMVGVYMMLSRTR